MNTSFDGNSWIKWRKIWELKIFLREMSKMGIFVEYISEGVNWVASQSRAVQGAVAAAAATASREVSMTMQQTLQGMDTKR